MTIDVISLSFRSRFDQRLPPRGTKEVRYRLGQAGYFHAQGVDDVPVVFFVHGGLSMQDDNTDGEYLAPCQQLVADFVRTR